MMSGDQASALHPVATRPLRSVGGWCAVAAPFRPASLSPGGPPTLPADGAYHAAPRCPLWQSAPDDGDALRGGPGLRQRRLRAAAAPGVRGADRAGALAIGAALLRPRD